MSESGGLGAREQARTLPQRPGVYRLLDASGRILYVGKARNLRRRAASYFTGSERSPRIAQLVAQAAGIDFTVTRTEAEALILENDLIKAHRPRYNVLLRDDKSYPYIYLSEHQAFPRLGFHRGATSGPGRYFGPFPSAGAVRETLNHLQKVFPIRQCQDSYFRNRSRPCLQYQIRRCTAPCVGYISPEAYRDDVRHATMFLEGRSSEVIDELVERMEAASEALDFERAARLRDRIAVLRGIQERQALAGEHGDLDVVACATDGRRACIQVFFVRQGRNLGNKAFFPQVPAGADEAEILSAFLARYYLGRPAPREVLVDREVPDATVIADALSREAGAKVGIRSRVRGERRRWVELAADNAWHALAAHAGSQAMRLHRLEALADALGLDALPERIECFDVSHTRGEETVAACVVFGEEGPLKSDYRRYNIAGVAAGDDYAAMRQALERRFARLKRGEGVVPDLLLVDGGRGQLGEALAVLEAYQIEGVTALAIAKGPSRRPGEEALALADERRELHLPPDSPALHLIQEVRDEAHRFAVTGHRGRRARKRRESALDAVPGIGPKRRRALLKHFGGVAGIKRAGVEDIARVPGVSRALAERIFEAFNG